MHGSTIRRGAAWATHAPRPFVSTPTSWRPSWRAAIVRLVTALLLAGSLGACGDASTHPSDASAGAPGSDADEHDTHEEHDTHDGFVVLGDQALRDLELDTARVTRRRLAPQIETTGAVDYDLDRVAHVGPRIDGRVVAAPASLGDSVDAGQLLAVLDSVALGQAEAAWLSAVAREDVARMELERDEALFADEITPERELLAARADHRIAHAERRHAEETLRLYGLDDESLESLAEHGTASMLRLVAPLGGTVVEKHATLGELAEASESLFTVADLDRVWVWIDIFERQLAHVHLGDDVEVRVEAFPEHAFTGEVTFLGAQVRPDTRTVRARIDVRNTERRLRPGMFAAVRLVDPHLTTAPTSLVVPAAAVQRQGDEAMVFVPRGDGRFEPRTITIGRREGDLVEVVSGLDADETVVTVGSFVLKSEHARDELGGGHSH